MPAVSITKMHKKSTIVQMNCVVLIDTSLIKNNSNSLPPSKLFKGRRLKIPIIRCVTAKMLTFDMLSTVPQSSMKTAKFVPLPAN